MNSLALVCAFKTLKVAMDESSSAVAAKWMVECERSRGGWTPTPLQAILNSLWKGQKIKNKLKNTFSILIQPYKLLQATNFQGYEGTLVLILQSILLHIEI